MAEDAAQPALGTAVGAAVDTTVDPALRFEQVVAQLELVIAQLEAGGLPLDQMVTAYGEGIALGARAQQLLDQAQLRIEQLQASAYETDE